MKGLRIIKKQITIQPLFQHSKQHSKDMLTDEKRVFSKKTLILARLIILRVSIMIQVIYLHFSRQQLELTCWWRELLGRFVILTKGVFWDLKFLLNKCSSKNTSCKEFFNQANTVTKSPYNYINLTSMKKSNNKKKTIIKASILTKVN